MSAKTAFVIYEVRLVEGPVGASVVSVLRVADTREDAVKYLSIPGCEHCVIIEVDRVTYGKGNKKK